MPPTMVSTMASRSGQNRGSTMATDTSVVTIQALPKQLEFLQSDATWTLLSGGFGCGKSLAVAIKLAMRAAVPGAREILARKYFATLGRSTLSTLLEGDGDQPPILPVGKYSHNKSTHVIRIHGGGQIDYLGIDTPEKLGSINATGAAIDEAAELSEHDVIMLRGRCRSRVQGLSRQVYMATNPAGPHHHLAKRFGLDGRSTPQPGHRSILMRTDENVYLPSEYIDDLDRLTGADRARFFEGRWVAAEGLVYPQFDHNAMVRSRPSPWTRVVCGQDAGFNDPDALIVVCQDADGRIHVADEWCKSGQLIDAVVEQAHRFREAHGVSEFAVDPSAARLRETLTAAGLYVTKAENSILDGVRTCQRYMTIDGDGLPRFTVDPCCVNLIKELQS